MVRLLGPVSIDAPGLIDSAEAPRTALSPKLRLLLALLASQRGSVVSVDRLCEALWGEAQPSSAVATLQSHLSRLRRMLEPEATVVSFDNGYRLDLPPSCVDENHFEELIRTAKMEDQPAKSAALYADALSWWRGPAFGDLADSEWIRAESVRLDEMRQSITEEWIEQRLACGGDPTLVGDLESLTAQHPLRERFLRQLLIALFREGRQTEALRRSDTFGRKLREEIGLDPSSALRKLETQILADDPALCCPKSPVTRSGSKQVLDDPTNLVGRESDLERISSALGGSALVTLLGPGGVGKTRLARRIAATADTFSHGVAFVELANVSDPKALIDSLATALDVQPGQHLSMEDSLLTALAEREQLLVFDNCEHLLDTLVPIVDRIRARCQQIRLLTTSRQPLGLPSELVLQIDPLELVPSEVADHEMIIGAAAVRLLLERVWTAVPAFELTTVNAPILAEICRRLDGLPLALELVAARFRSLSAEVVLQLLVTRSGMLEASMRSSDPRHRTLRDTIAWSFEHLDPAEQDLFSRLSAFAGSFDLAAAESVCKVPDSRGPSFDGALVETLVALVDKSMVHLVDSGGVRYQLLETLREFAREKLADFGSTEIVHDAHLRWFTAFAEEAGQGLDGAEEAVWSQRIESDFDDFRAAHQRAVRIGDGDAALRIVAGLRDFAFRRIRYELTAWANNCLNMPDIEAHPRFPVVLATVGYGHFVRGDLELSIEVARRVVALSDGHSDSSGLAERTLGNALFYLGETEEALQWMDAMVESARSGSTSRLAHALYMRSVAETSVGRTVHGAIMAGESQAAARLSGSPTARAQACYALGLALEGSAPGESLDLLRESSQLAAVAGNRWIEAFAQTEVWWMTARTGDYRAALAGSSRVIDTWHRGGDWANLQLSLRRVFGLFIRIGDHHSAAVLHGALSASGALLALPFEPSDASELDGAVELLRQAMGSAEFEAAVADGHAMPGGLVVSFVQRQIS